MEKNNSFTSILLTVLIALVATFAGYYFGNKNAEKTTATNNNQQANNEVGKEIDCVDVNSQSQSYMHVFTYLNSFKGYNLYAFLNNQGTEMQVFDYKGNLYLTEGSESDQCVFDLVEGNVKFKNNKYSCAYLDDNEEENEEDRDATTVLTKLNVKTEDVVSVKLINSCRSDAAPFTLIVKKDGTVSYYDGIEGRSEMKDNYFKGNTIKDVTGFKCENQQEAGYKDSVFTVLLEDETTKKITK